MKLPEGRDGTNPEMMVEIGTRDVGGGGSVWRAKDPIGDGMRPIGVGIG